MENDVIFKNVPRQQYKEIVLNNVVDEDLQSLLRPLDLMQNLFICAKYSIRDNFITSNKSFYQYFSLFLVFCYSGFLIYLLIRALQLTDLDPLFLDLSLRFFYLFCTYSAGCFVNSISNITHCNNNVLLVLKIQRVKRILKIDGSALKSLLVSNWFCVIIINILYIIEKIYYHNGISLEMSSFFVQLPNILFGLNIVYATFIIKLLRKILDVWVQKIKKPAREESQRKSYWNEMFQVYSDILEAYNLFQRTFRLIITFQTIYMVSYSLMIVSIIIQISLYWGGGIMPLLLTISSLEWIVKRIVLIVYFCNECVMFYDIMDKTKHLNIEVLFMESGNVSDVQMRMVKNIQRLQRASFKKMSAYGLFVVDATLPLQLAGVISTYTIAQLQLSIP